MKELESIDMLLSLIDIENSRDEMEGCLEYVSNRTIQCVAIDAVDEDDKATINLYNNGHGVRWAEAYGGTWYNYSNWYVVILTRKVSMTGAHKLEDRDEIDLLFDKMRMMVI